MVYVELRRDLKMSFVASALRPALAGQEQKLRQAAGTGRKGASHDMGVPDNGGKIWEWWSTIKFGGTLCSEKTTVIQRPSHPTSSDMNHLQGLILSIIRQGDLMAARERERRWSVYYARRPYIVSTSSFRLPRLGGFTFTCVCNCIVGYTRIQCACIYIYICVCVNVCYMHTSYVYVIICMYVCM